MRIRSSQNRRTWVAALSCASVLALTCCSLFVDTDGLENGDDAAITTTDAASDVAFDSNFDSATFDATTPSDGSTSNVFSCDGGHLICDDFEGPTLIPPWSKQNLVGGGMLGVVSTLSVSPTHSLHAIAPTNASGAGANLFKSLSQPMTKLHCEFDVYVTTGAPQAFAATFASSDPNIAYHYISFTVGFHTYITTADIFPDAGGNYAGGPSTNVVANNVWTHIVLDFEPNGSGGTQFSAIAGDGGPNVKPSNTLVGANLTDITLSEDYAVDAFEQYVDNFVCDVSP